MRSLEFSSWTPTLLACLPRGNSHPKLAVGHVYACVYALTLGCALKQYCCVFGFGFGFVFLKATDLTDFKSLTKAATVQPKNKQKKEANGTKQTRGGTAGEGRGQESTQKSWSVLVEIGWGGDACEE